MFEKFTEGAIKVIMLSQEEARRMGHNFVGTEQLLLGVIGQRHGIGARSLKKIKITLKKARKEIELYIGRGTGFVASEIPFTPRAKRVLEMAVHEGKDLGQNFVGTEHILLALIAESDGVAMRTLDKLRVNIPQLRNLILAYIEETLRSMEDGSLKVRVRSLENEKALERMELTQGRMENLVIATLFANIAGIAAGPAFVVAGVTGAAIFSLKAVGANTKIKKFDKTQAKFVQTKFEGDDDE